MSRSLQIGQEKHLSEEMKNRQGKEAEVEVTYCSFSGGLGPLNNASTGKLFHICAQQMTESCYLVPSSPVALLESELHLHVSLRSCLSAAHAGEQPSGLLICVGGSAYSHPTSTHLK